MGALKNARHEAFCVAIFRGATLEAAYKGAGYRPSRAHAARLATNGSIQARLAELKAEASKKATTFAAINWREQMHKMLEIRDAALAAGNVKEAREAQEFILRCGGYEDSPTLTHEHMSDAKLTKDEEKSVEQDQPQMVLTARFPKTMAELRKRVGGT